MTRILYRFTFATLILGIIMFLGHSYYTDSYTVFIPLKKFYLINLAVVLITFWGIFWKSQRKPKSSAKSYVYFAVIKMIVLAITLYQYIMPKTDNSKIIVGHFFIIFFAFLLVETIGVVKIINQPFDAKRNLS